MSTVVRIHKLGGPEVLQLDELDVGAPGPGEVRLDVEAVGLNRAEALYRQGNYPQKPQLPSRIGYEGVGVIDAIGPGVQGFDVGQRVCVVPNVRQGEYGLCAEKAIVATRSLLPAPPGLTPVEAASIWMQYFTALAIYEAAHATTGDYVVVRAASSSVGIAAIQLANWAGAVSIACTRRSAKAEALKKQGAQHVVATEESDLVAEIMRITGGKGARIVFDPVGGPEVDKLAQAMAERGVLIIYGSLSGAPTVFPHWPAAFKGLSLRGWVASEIWNKPHRFARCHQLILQGLAQGRLKPVIARTFPLAQVAEAHRYLESNQHLGKIVITVN
jgi:NADPH:quinone reductase-like Zn-dependent oxidoreductase